MIINNSVFKIPNINSVICYDTTDSTNKRAKDFARKTDIHGILFLAERQTSGKGRIGRTFSSPEGTGIYMSLLLRPKIDVNRYSQITLVAALSVAKAIKEITGIAASIKWPNDIVIGGKKLVGILTEGGPGYAIVGIGINVNNTLFDDELSASATSLYLETGAIVNRSVLLDKILRTFNDLYEAFISSDNLNFMMDEYNQLLASMDKDIFVIPHHISDMTDNPYLIDTSGLTPLHCKGIDYDGNLLCIQDDGTTLYVNSGEVSIRGINGYST